MSQQSSPSGPSPVADEASLPALRRENERLRTEVARLQARLASGGARTRPPGAGASDVDPLDVDSFDASLRGIFNTTFQFIALLAPDGVVVEANRTALAFGGLCREDVVGRPFWECRWWSRAPEALAALQEAVRRAAAGELVRYEADLYGADGSADAVDFSIKPVCDGAGRVTLLIAEGRDITERRRAERERDRIFELSRDLLAVAGTDGYFRRLNPAWEETLGYSRNELMRLPFLDLVHPEDREQTRRELEKLSIGSPTLLFENRYRHKDGTYRWLAWSADAVPEEGLLYCSARDVTRRKEAEQALQQLNHELERRVAERTARLEEINLDLAREIAARRRVERELRKTSEAVEHSLVQLEAVIRSIDQGLVLSDPDGSLLTMNPAALRLHGFATLDEARQVLPAFPALFDVSTPEGRPLPPEAWPLARALAGETFSHLEVRVRRKDTGSTWIGSYGSTPVRDRDGEMLLVVLTVEDVTERRQAETALRESEARLNRLVNSGLMGVLYWNMDGGVTDANDRFLAMIGATREELERGMIDWTALTPPAYRPMDLHALEQLKATGLCQPYEKAFRCKDGTSIPVLIGAAMLDEARHAGVAFTLDIAEQKQAEEALRQREAELRELNETLERRVRTRTAELSRANRTLEQRNRELQDFAYIASHDLQEPLRKIHAFADLLRSDYGAQLDEAGLHYLQRMQHAAARMANLISDLLTFSRVKTQNEPFTRIALEEIAREVVSDLEARLQESGGEVEIGPLPTLQADPVQMRQLLTNLLGNALKFHHPDVPPRIRVEGEVDAESAAPGTGPMVRLRVQDNGIGFEEKYLDRIFSPFQRLHSRGTYEGTGMGLAICRRIVERHNGVITALSTPGRGSTFIVSLPQHQFAAEEKASGPGDGSDAR